ncbi:GNAT family N-acetyltransferase [Croceibacterium sp. TMG7-5b_MA50]|uniref:GNAT family N-acetyltransferase n=1 Tax=Croceibacterium sp. TMG7-5b_MA50 TaxID=3121290 RepID=UPI003222184F
MTVLRRALPADAESLARLARESFDAAFGHLYPPADLAHFHTHERSAGKYAGALADPATRVAVVEEDGELIAYALIVMGGHFVERPAPQPQRPVLLSQLYCAGVATGRGLGVALLDWTLAEAQGWNADAIQLSVYSGNHGAQRFYQRHGFAHVADIHFWVGQTCDDEFLYERRLK